jgi:hypothetical protein
MFRLDCLPGDNMSTAVVERVISQPVLEQPAVRDRSFAGPAAAASKKEFADPHPLLPVFIAGAIAFALSVGFVGSIVAGLLLRNSGIMAQ